VLPGNAAEQLVAVGEVQLPPAGVQVSVFRPLVVVVTVADLGLQQKFDPQSEAPPGEK